MRLYCANRALPPGPATIVRDHAGDQIAVVRRLALGTVDRHHGLPGSAASGKVSSCESCMAASYTTPASAGSTGRAGSPGLAAELALLTGVRALQVLAALGVRPEVPAARGLLALERLTKSASRVVGLRLWFLCAHVAILSSWAETVDPISAVSPEPGERAGISRAPGRGAAARRGRWP